MSIRRAIAAGAVASALTLASLTATTITADAQPNGTDYCPAWVRGIDVSNWQGQIDWSQVPSSGIAYAWSKTSEGTNYVDPTWVTNAFGAAGAGIPWGGYHYAHPNFTPGTDALAQAAFFVDHGGMAGTLPGMLDLEETDGLSRDEVGFWARQFLTEAQRLSGRFPILYVGGYFAVNYDWLSDFPLMMPSYTAGYEVDVNPCAIRQPYVPGQWAGWDVWQYSSVGRVAGIGGNVDSNVMTPEFFARVTGLGSAPAPVVVPVPVADTPAPWTVYRIGSRGPGVENIQRLLGVAVDGIYGRGTATAVANLQTSLGVTADGVWGVDTQQAVDALFVWLASAPAEPSPPVVQHVDVPAPTLRQGPGFSFETVALQSFLASFGYWIDVDGVYGRNTAAIVADFQARAGLTVDGIYGPDTATVARFFANLS